LADHAAASVTVLPVPGIPEVRPGDDLAALLVTALRAGPGLLDGDVVVVTSKVVSKAEGRVVPAPEDPEQREAARLRIVEDETVRVVARRGTTTLVETRHGLVLAAAGVDASNVADGQIALLPLDPDASATALVVALQLSFGVTCGVIVSDTLGRAWRVGQTDVAIGAAGITVIADHRGSTDQQGRVLGVTELAVVDEIAGAADLVKGKRSGVAAAVVRGVGHLLGEGNARQLVRPGPEDLFRVGVREVVGMRRTVRRWTTAAVSDEIVQRAIVAGLSAPAPHHSQPFRFVVVRDHREQLLDAMRTAWVADLEADGFTEEQIARRVARGDVLRRAPLLIVPCLVLEQAHVYPDPRRQAAEERMFLVAGGGAVENLLVQLAAEGLGACWVSSALFCADVAASALELPAHWRPLGTVALGHPEGKPDERPAPDLSELIVQR
jgi:coenzyme F420-0:L-glutamate ligase/coenzyme F420-1:gamma-L-glutamate ligase